MCQSFEIIFKVFAISLCCGCGTRSQRGTMILFQIGRNSGSSGSAHYPKSFGTITALQECMCLCSCVWSIKKSVCPQRNSQCILLSRNPSVITKHIQLHHGMQNQLLKTASEVSERVLTILPAKVNGYSRSKPKAGRRDGKCGLPARSLVEPCIMLGLTQMNGTCWRGQLQGGLVCCDTNDEHGKGCAYINIHYNQLSIVAFLLLTHYAVHLTVIISYSDIIDKKKVITFSISYVLALIDSHMRLLVVVSLPSRCGRRRGSSPSCTRTTSPGQILPERPPAPPLRPELCCRK